MRRAARVLPVVALLAAIPAGSAAQSRGIDVTVTEGTSMSVAASRDGRLLAIDLQGGVWVLPVEGGRARRVTDEYNDARQPVWSSDGRTIAFQGYRDGGYDIWAVDADGTHQRKLTSGPYDDREPAWSADGRWVAFSSDRSGSYDIWLLEVATGALRQLTHDPGEDYMPTFSPDGGEIAFIGTRDRALGVYAISLSSGRERTVVSGGRYDAPSWGPGGAIVYHNTVAGEARLEVNGRPITGGENAFAFRAGWLSPGEIVYVSDGRIRRRRLDGSESHAIDFSATLRVTRPAYVRRKRDVWSRAPRRARGILSPAISPDGKQVVFAALGNLYRMPVGGVPRRLTDDAAMDVDPAWSPDGRYLAWSTDRAGGSLLDLWVLDTQTGATRQLTAEPTSAMGAAWSPDGKRIAYLDVDGIWRRASVWVVDVGTGKTTQIHESLFGPGAPTWSADGKRVMVAALKPYSTRFREGTNQLLSFSASGGDDRWYAPVEHLSIDSRVGAGPAWSPDGRSVALIHEGQLSLVPVSAEGAPTGAPRRLTSEIAHAPSWTADARHILYESNDRLRLLDLESGVARDVPLDLSYTPSISSQRVVVHAGRLIDGRSPRPRENVDVVLVGNRIESVSPHAATRHGRSRVVDASGLTVMPGLIEYHTHLQKDLASAAYRAYLALGITTVRSPGSSPYEAVEDREAVDAGVRPGPRLFVTGYLMEWQRAYYKMSVAVANDAHLERELQRARALQFDLIKSYVRMPDLQQRRIAEFAHSIGVPTSSHEIFPAAWSGVDGVEHTTGTSRRGYSPKAATLQRSYGDVAALFAASGMSLTPTLALSGDGLRRLVAHEPSFADDPRLKLYPPWLQATVPTGGGAPPGVIDPTASGQMVVNLMRSGTRIVAGTDTPNAATLHGELYSYVLAGMSPFEALRTATVNSATMLGLDAGTIEAGRLADLVIVDGNPLEDVTTATHVRYTIANGRVFDVRDLVKPR